MFYSWYFFANSFCNKQCSKIHERLGISGGTLRIGGQSNKGIGFLEAQDIRK